MEWNGIFSLPILFLLATKIVTASFSLFGFLQGLFMKEILLSGIHFLLLVIFLLDCFMQLVVFMAADKPIQEVI